MVLKTIEVGKVVDRMQQESKNERMRKRLNSLRQQSSQSSIDPPRSKISKTEYPRVIFDNLEINLKLMWRNLETSTQTSLRLSLICRLTVAFKRDIYIREWNLCWAVFRHLKSVSSFRGFTNNETAQLNWRIVLASLVTNKCSLPTHCSSSWLAPMSLKIAFIICFSLRLERFHFSESICVKCFGVVENISIGEMKMNTWAWQEFEI